MENAMFVMENLRVTQGEDRGSHLGTHAIDFGGKDTGMDKVYAPFSGTIVRTRKNANGEMYLQSDEPVKYADGTVDYMTVTFIHDNKFNLSQGAHVTQGQYIYDEGGMGGGRAGAFGNHLHLEVSRGLIAPRQIKNRYGRWQTANGYPIYDALMLGNDVKILNSGGYNWKRRSDLQPSAPTAPKPEPRTYTVQAGDSWWRIASQQLGAGSKCYALAKANGKTILSVLRPGDRLTLEV